MDRVIIMLTQVGGWGLYTHVPECHPHYKYLWYAMTQSDSGFSFARAGCCLTADPPNPPRVLQAEHLIPPNASFIVRNPAHAFTGELWDLWQPGGWGGGHRVCPA
jgi:hypothetical protein